MSLAQGFLILSLLTNIALAVLILAKSSPFYRRLNRIFALLCFVSSLWILGALMTSLTTEPQWKLFWVRFIFGISSFIPSLFLHFSLLFPNYHDDIRPPRLWLLYFPSFLFLIFSQTRLVVESLIQVNPALYDYGSLHGFFSLFLAVYIGAGLWVLVRTHRNAVGTFRLQIIYVFLGMLLTSMAGLFTNLLLPALGTSKYSSLGPSSTMIMVGFAAYAIVKHRLMDIHVVLKKGTTYVLLLLLLFLPSFLLVLVSQKVAFGKIDTFFSVFLFLTLFVVTILFARIRPRTEKAVEQLLFRDRYDYRETLSSFSRALVTILDFNALSREIIETVTRTMGIEQASLFSLHEERDGFSLIASKDPKRSSPSSLLPMGEPLPQYLQAIKEVVVKDELIKGARLPELRRVADQMTVLGAEVSIPLVLKRRLVGIINLGYKPHQGAFSNEDIELLGTLANQAAIALENARLYEDLKKSKSYIRRADRLASLGTLTAGLAHEIRNPLVALKTLTQLLPERLDDEEFRSHFLGIASGEVDRIASLVNELLDFARPSDPKFETEDINAILEGMILLVSTETKKKQIQLSKAFSQDLPPIEIDREQIKQVFLNVLLNAIEATSENGSITASTRIYLRPSGETYVQVEIADSGCGIPREHLEDIFNPFFTTKPTGSGLGLSISNQIVQDHRGFIHVESEMSKRTSFFINLPVDQDHPKRRQTDVEARRLALGPVEQR